MNEIELYQKESEKRENYEKFPSTTKNLPEIGRNLGLPLGD